MSRGRFGIYLLVYLILVLIGEGLAIRDLFPSRQGGYYTANMATMTAHTVFLGILGLPLSAVGLWITISASRNAGLAGGFAAGALLMMTVWLAPLVNLAILWLIWRRWGTIQRKRAAKTAAAAAAAQAPTPGPPPA